MQIEVKSKFLANKKKQKNKLQEVSKNNSDATALNKNIRAFIGRRSLINDALKNRDIKCLLLLNSTSIYDDKNDMIKFLSAILNKNLSRAQSTYYSRKIIDNVFKDVRLILIVLEILAKNPQLIKDTILKQNFSAKMNKILKIGKGQILLEIFLKQLILCEKIGQIDSNILYEQSFKRFRRDYVEIQQQYKKQISLQSCILLSNYFRKIRYHPQLQQIFQTHIKFLNSILNLKDNDKFTSQYQNTICYSLQLILQQIFTRRSTILKQLEIQNKQLLALVSDAQQIEYLEQKIKNDPQYQDFSNYHLQQLKQLFHQKSELIVLSRKSQEVGKLLVVFLKELNHIFANKKLFFISELLSSDQTIKILFVNRSSQFYEYLRSKLVSMDDQQFQQWKCFTNTQWKQIIQLSVKKALEVCKKIIVNSNKIKKIVLFERKNDDQIYIKVISELLTNLYKKTLRTKKLSQQWFINIELSNSLNTFSFGTGGKLMEIMLKNFPFIFSFENRVYKLRQFIKEDKKNHDRTLFLQEEVDDDLIIQVRRGYQFLDAFHVCMQRDLRKKYKLIFFNEQGLQQQGIDGGGIIKQFINRVLKMAFSENFNLFYETQQNQLLPNPYAVQIDEYEFIGKIIGKAVYQSITIEPKFAEPFLNLLINRENTFEDIQYIDKKIYKSLLQIKHMGKQLNDIEQTFTIFDQLPNGQKKYINLLNPNKPTSKDVFVTEENKIEFINAYTDFKCNHQLREKTRHFRRGFVKVVKSEWLTMFNNEELNLIISGSTIDFSVNQLKIHTVYNDYNEKHPTIIYFWDVLSEFTTAEKGLFLNYVTSCSRPPTLGFSKLRPHFCISNGGPETNKLPTANTCMNVLRLPSYKTKNLLKQKLLYAIKSKAGFQFA